MNSGMKTKGNHLAIKSWVNDERPRERLLEMGCSVLSDAELLAIILGSGNTRETAVDLARRLLRESGNRFWGLSRVSVDGLCKFSGVGPAKAAAISATMEIAKRFLEPPERTQPIRESRDAFLQLKPLLAHLDHEEFWVLCLNNANRVITVFQLSKGGLTGTLVDVRILLRKALETGAVGLILAHNHPSGNLSPSRADVDITKKVKKASETMDIRVLDHIILSGAEYYSFADEQLL
jgi:DNA repair protein RadC